MALRKKLYYDLFITDVHTSTPGDVTYYTARRFIEGSGPNFGVGTTPPNQLNYHLTQPQYSDPDRYGNVLEANQYNGLGVGTGLAVNGPRQTIGAWFQCSALTAVGTGRPPGLPGACVDFIAETGALNTAVEIDPASVRRPRVRVKWSLASGETLRGTLYIQRQHTIEV